VSYAVESGARVSIALFNANGRLLDIVADEYRNSGRHSVRIDPAEAGNGMVVLRARIGNSAFSKKYFAGQRL
jgi:hypothetical protein